MVMMVAVLVLISNVAMQAIISNPPTYGHIHCAEKLGVPLQMFFTMPWSPTKVVIPHAYNKSHLSVHS